jgi:hypothetical protein
MEHFKAAVCALISGGSSVLAWVSLQNTKDMAALLASLIAALSGWFAIRYYYYAAQEKKQILKNLKK